jgi:hypothetical protein
MMVESRAAVRLAEQHGAERDPAAAQYLVLARQQIADAQRLMDVGRNWSASRLLEDAQVNAEMAGELARQANAHAEAIEAQRDIDQLRGRIP